MIPLRDENPSHHFPLVCITLIVLCILGFIYELSLGSAAEAFLIEYGVVPLKVSAGRSLYSLISSLFLHGGWGHLVGNLWYLWIFGDNLEDFLGHTGFLFFYLLTGMAAGAIHVALYPSSPTPTIGASGAISGVMGGYMVLHPRIRVTTLIPLGFFFKVVQIPAIFFLAIWFVLNFIGIFGSNESIAFGAHLGGFVCGALIMAVLTRRRPQPPLARFESRRLRRW